MASFIMAMNILAGAKKARGQGDDPQGKILTGATSGSIRRSLRSSGPMVFGEFWDLLRRALGLEKVRRRKRGTRSRGGPGRLRRTPKKRLRDRGRRAASRRPKKKIPKRQPVKRRAAKSRRKRVPAAKPQVLLGVVTHYYPNVRAAVVRLKRSLWIGAPIHIKGKKTDFRQTVASIQIDRVPMEKAGAGREIGLEVMKEVRIGDLVFLSQ